MERRPRVMPGLGQPERPLRRRPGGRGRRVEGSDQRGRRGSRVTEGRHTARLVLKGHIIDSMMLPQIMDLVMDMGGNFTIEELNVGQHKTDTSLCRMELTAPDARTLDEIMKRCRDLGAIVPQEEPAELVEVPKAGVFPEGFYSTTNLPTHVLLGDR